ncbi:glycosyltransferase family 2 protein [Nocardioides litoris]|uniref:glycosyltransferase family 2 protein n=1 Tax=Nocardioides litoris TaxID=1926648 RepID=UPI00111DE561|nr:glycosyltransferase family 2 protein [Nocardioides litoris]
MPARSTSPRVLVIVPAWNESATVGATVQTLREAHPHYDVLVVDDGSGDDTAGRARESGALVCQLPYNLGVGGAMRTGYRYAVRHGYDVAAQVDADGQHDPAYLAHLVDALDLGGTSGAAPPGGTGEGRGADIVIGARFAGLGDYRVGLARGLAMRMLAVVLSRLAGTRLTDVTSGFRVVNRRAMTTFAVHYPAEYLGDTVESLVIALRTGCAVTQVPVVMLPRAGGVASQSPARAALYLVRAVVALGLALVRRWPSTLEVEPAALERS